MNTMSKVTRQAMPNSRQSGFTLVELIVGMTVGILVLGAIGAVFVPALATYRNTQAVGSIQENARLATDRLTEAVSQAGFFGCDSTEPENMVLVAENFSGLLTWVGDMGAPARIAAADATNAELTPRIGATGVASRSADATGNIGDVMTLLSTSGTNMMVLDHDMAAETLTFQGNVVSALDNQVILLNDCNQTAMLQIANGTWDGTNSTFSYAEDDTTNCGSGVDDVVRLGSTGGTPSCTTPATYTDYQYRAGASASRLNALSFFIGPSSLNNASAISSGRAAPVNSLYSVTVNAAGAFSLPNEIIAGVDNFRALYGVMTSGGEVNYVSARSFDGDGAGTDVDGDGTNETFDNVVSIDVSLLLSSISDRGERGDSARQEFSFPDYDGATMVDCSAAPSNQAESSACPSYMYQSAAEARRLRRVVSKTFTLRNIVL